MIQTSLPLTGYSVLEEKKLLSRDDYTVVTGAPRDESKGLVMFGKKSDGPIELVLLIPGEQVGSYFGNCLAVTDRSIQTEMDQF